VSKLKQQSVRIVCSGSSNWHGAVNLGPGNQRLPRKSAAAVIAAFKAAYPTATIKGYAREKEHGQTCYESKAGRRHGRDILYHPDGSVAEIEETVAASDLPAAAQAVIRSQYPGRSHEGGKNHRENAQGDKVGYE